jgi:hypothetical protein
VDADDQDHIAMSAQFGDPPLWQFLLIVLSTGVGLRAQWDGAQWWTESELPIANHHVINWRAIN